MRVAFVHDWLTGYRGGERVLHHLARRFPEADLYTLIHDRGSLPCEIEDRRIITSILDDLPGREGYYRKLLPLFPWAIRRFDFSGYDLVLSTSHAVAKSVHVPQNVPHLSYCFTPMRYVWDQVDAYLGRGPRRWLATPMVRALRRFDVATSGPDSVARFVAISSEVADRIWRHYGRAAAVVPPPVDISWIEPAQAPAEDFYLLVSSFVPYKNDALAIETFRRSGRRLIVVGDGHGRGPLERGCPRNIEFVGRVDDATLARLYRRCRALVYPQREDFGLIAVEAQAAGRPVIAYGAGGVVDTVRPLTNPLVEDPAAGTTGGLDATGIFFDRQTPEALAGAIERFEAVEHRFEPEYLRHWAERFSPERFDAAFDHEIAATLDRFHNEAPGAPRAPSTSHRPRPGPDSEARPDGGGRRAA
ncbi:MAG: glycosyl transferase family 1 [Deltaproteobacteria bacterium]|nr:glycosyl transferase family 1 [Deltaproteobacteria bacterium]